MVEQLFHVFRQEEIDRISRNDKNNNNFSTCCSKKPKIQKLNLQNLDVDFVEKGEWDDAPNS